MIWKQLSMKGLLNGVCSFEINLVFDNCSGQNKNRMVLRMLFVMVKQKVCRTARAIFLIKGHTKNDCDQMFNQMKYNYRKVDCYTPSELLTLLNNHPQVTAVAMEPDDFKNWDAMENQMIRKADSILKNHVFTVRARDSNRIMIQEYDRAPIQRQLLVKKPFQGDVDWNELFQPTVLKAPGLA